MLDKLQGRLTFTLETDSGELVRFLELTREQWTCFNERHWSVLSQRRWHAVCIHNWYAATNNGPRLLYMHQLISGSGADHIDRNGLNNLDSNLRMPTRQAQQNWNKGPLHKTSKYKGVSYDSRSNKWHSVITADKRSYTLLGLAVSVW
jgi:hypothetical protein